MPQTSVVRSRDETPAIGSDYAFTMGDQEFVGRVVGYRSKGPGDVYADWDVDQLAETMAQVLADDGESFQSSS